MYVCICHQITEEQLIEANKKSSGNKDALAKLGVGDSCGICLIDALKKLSDSNTEQPHSTKVSKTNFSK